METIFDHNITDEELKSICADALSLNEYFHYMDEIIAYQDIAALFYIRGNMKKAKEYADKLPLTMRYEFWRTMTHP